MPTYQYACTEPECGHAFEQVQSFSDDALTACPQCEGRLRKVFNAVGVVFKGSGFYRTDSRATKSGDGPSGDSSASGDSKPGESTGASKGDSKGDSAASGSSSSSSTSASSSSAPAGAGAA